MQHASPMPYQEHAMTPEDDPQAQDLLAAAEAVQAKAYAPYSRFHVGCAVLSGRGEVYAACNVENASYPVGTCAERNAIAKAIASEGPAFSLASLALVAYHDGRRVPCSPCGACRQAIAEFGKSANVIFDNGSGSFVSESAAALLPYGFTL